MKTFITVIMFSIILSSPVFAEEEVTETYTDTGVPAQDRQVSAPSGLHATRRSSIWERGGGFKGGGDAPGG